MNAGREDGVGRGEFGHDDGRCDASKDFRHGYGTEGAAPRFGNEDESGVREEVSGSRRDGAVADVREDDGEGLPDVAVSPDRADECHGPA